MRLSRHIALVGFVVCVAIAGLSIRSERTELLDGQIVSAVDMNSSPAQGAAAPLTKEQLQGEIAQLSSLVASQ